MGARARCGQVQDQRARVRAYVWYTGNQQCERTFVEVRRGAVKVVHCRERLPAPVQSLDLVLVRVLELP